MQIRSLKAIPVRLPLSKPVRMAGVKMTATENLLVRVEDENGVVGWGEAASAPTMTGETAVGMLAAVRWMLPRLEGSILEDPGDISSIMDRYLYGNTGVKSAIEMAVYDAVARRRGLPLYEVLGGRRRRDVPVFWVLGAGDLAKDSEAARQKCEEGFAAFKAKIGIGASEKDGVALDLGRLAAIRDATGSGMQISADANQGYSREQGFMFVEGIAPTILDFLEQPVPGHDLEGMQSIASASKVPIGADEGIHDLEDIRSHAAAGAAHGVGLKTIKFGGIGGVMAAGKLADSLNLKVNLSGKMAECSIASAAIAHLAVALQQIEWSVGVTNQYLAEDVVGQRITVQRGRLAPDEAPGLGVDVDEARVARFAFAP